MDDNADPLDWVQELVLVILEKATDWQTALDLEEDGVPADYIEAATERLLDRGRRSEHETESLVRGHASRVTHRYL